MKQVTRDEFYKKIGPMDVVLSIAEEHPPYNTKFKLRNGVLLGIIKENFIGGLSFDQYYLSK